ncbi:MAG TPA: hypothetical protein VHZ74_18600, partial [Bryobacteraceae bacterium]|nr:hypothetical protein [Bryobacteraceae bacterium]
MNVDVLWRNNRNASVNSFRRCHVELWVSIHIDTWNQPYTENLEKERRAVNAGNGDITQLLSQWVSDGVIAAMVAHPSTSPSPQPGEGQIGKDKVYISDSESWAASGGFTMSHGSGGGGFVGGSKPQTVELIKTFGQRCPSVLVTMDRI